MEEKKISPNWGEGKEGGGIGSGSHSFFLTRLYNLERKRGRGFSEERLSNRREKGRRRAKKVKRKDLLPEKKREHPYYLRGKEKRRRG